MNEVNRASAVREQYKTAGNLTARISIHQKYSVNRLGFGNWLWQQYSDCPQYDYCPQCGWAGQTGLRILELGCGTGELWRGHEDVIDVSAGCVLTDFSEGMLETAKKNLGERQNLTFQVVDVQSIPYPDAQFDVVIANMMLYHVPDLHRGLAEIARVLRKDGVFCCATYGEYGITAYITELLRDYGVRDGANKNFTLQNGGAILGEHFSSVERRDYEDSLAVTDVDDLLAYLDSLSGMTDFASVDHTVVREVLQSHKIDGVLRVPKEYGTFVCRK